MDYVVAVHFPDGTVQQNVDFSNTMAYVRIGELFIVQSEPHNPGPRYRVADVQHQFRREQNGLKAIMTNIILAGEAETGGLDMGSGKSWTARVSSDRGG